MEHPHIHPQPIVGFLISMLVFLFGMTIAEISEMARLVFTFISIVAMIITTSYTIWKWRSERRKDAKIMEIISDKENEKKPDHGTHTKKR